jgi:hypothetical protein
MAKSSGGGGRGKRSAISGVLGDLRKSGVTGVSRSSVSRRISDYYRRNGGNMTNAARNTYMDLVGGSRG